MLKSARGDVEHVANVEQSAQLSAEAFADQLDDFMHGYSAQRDFDTVLDELRFYIQTQLNTPALPKLTVQSAYDRVADAIVDEFKSGQPIAPLESSNSW